MESALAAIIAAASPVQAMGIIIFAFVTGGGVKATFDYLINKKKLDAKEEERKDKNELERIEKIFEKQEALIERMEERIDALEKDVSKCRLEKENLLERVKDLETLISYQQKELADLQDKLIEALEGDESIWDEDEDYH